MIDDAELQAAVEGRRHWESAGAAAAVYRRPGSPATVRVQRITDSTTQERYVAAVVQPGAATYSKRWFSAGEAVAWAERPVK